MTLQSTLNRAIELLQHGRAADAEAVLRQALQTNPDQPDVLHLLGLAAKGQNDPRRAEQHYRRSLDIAPGQPAVWNNLGNLLKAEGRHYDAVEAYQRALALAPQYLDGWKNLGLAQAAAGRHEQALEAYERALALAGQDVHVLVAKGLSLVALERLDEAEAVYGRAVEAAPNSVMALNNLGNLLRDRGKDMDAVEVFRRAARLAPQAGHLRVALAGALYKLRRFDEAEALLTGVLETEPDNLEAHRSLTSLYFTTGRSADTTKAYEATLARHPQLVELWGNYAETTWRLNENEAALAIINRAEAACGRTPWLRLLRARIMSSSGDPAGALSHLKDASDIPAPLEPYFAVERARAYLRLGEFDTGADNLYPMWKRHPDDYAILAHLEALWRLAGDERGAWLIDYDRFVRPLEVPVPRGFRDHKEFNAALAEFLNSLHVSREQPIDQTVRGGTQTFGNLFRRTEPIVIALKEAVTEAVRSYTAGLDHDPAHPFLRHVGRPITFKGSWSVRLRNEGYHVHHFHPEGWISSAYYVALPDVVADPDTPDGRLEFGKPPVEVPQAVPPVKHVQPRLGTLALFPSYCLHGTVPFRSEDVRMTVAFDISRD